MPYGFNNDKSKFDLDNINSNIAAIETSPVTNNHSLGDYIIYDGTLLRVISSITAGESLVLGTNVMTINLGDHFITRVGTAVDNANNYVKEGRWAFNTGNSMSNMPLGVNQYGLLFVFTQSSGSESNWFGCVQICISGANIWMRHIFGTDWYPWVRLTMSAGNITNYNFTNLNQITEEGRYSINQSYDGQISNVPSGFMWFELYVFTARNPNNVTQIAVNGTNNAAISFRTCHDSTNWTAWRSISIT